MKGESGIYLLAYLGGVVIINLVGNAISLNSNVLSRYSLASLSFRGIVYEEYFFYVLFLRLRTVLGLWISSKLIPKKIVTVGFGIVLCSMLGGVTALAILENGLWGILFCICAFFPHAVCYGVAYVLWDKMSVVYTGAKVQKETYLTMILVVALIGVGCVLEAYISPVLIESIIKY